MKNHSKSSWLLYVLLFLFSACKDELEQPAPTYELSVLVVNSQNIPIPNAEVRVYGSADNWSGETNEQAKKITDAGGTVTFSGLDHENIWIKATWIDHTTREVFQNTLVSFEPIDPIPANSKVTYRVKVNSSKVLKGIRIKEVAYSGLIYTNCDSDRSNESMSFCNYYPSVEDVSGPGCDLYLLIENTTSYYSGYAGNYFFRSGVKVDTNTDNIVFEVNDTITDFRRPYFIGVREHLIANPENHKSFTCSSSAEYPTLGHFLESKAGQEYMFSSVDRYITAKMPLLNVKNSMLPSYPADEVTIKLSSYNDQNLKLHLEWIY